MSVLGEVLVAVLLIVGALLHLLAAVGMHRFPDVFARMHAATKPATLGLGLILAVVAVRLGLTEATADAGKFVLVIALQFLTVPVAAHMVARAAHRAGTPVSPATAVDELAEAERAETEGVEHERAEHERGAGDDQGPGAD